MIAFGMRFHEKKQSPLSCNLNIDHFPYDSLSILINQALQIFWNIFQRFANSHALIWNLLKYICDALRDLVTFVKF